MNRDLPIRPLFPSVDSSEGFKAQYAAYRTASSAWLQRLDDLTESAVAKRLAGITPDEALRRRPFETSIIRHKLGEPLSYQCIRGHFVKIAQGPCPKVCGKCGDAAIEACECGASLLLTYTYDPPYKKVNPFSHVAPREVCFGCLRLYPWTYAYLNRPTEDGLNEYEELLLPFCACFPEKIHFDRMRAQCRLEIPPVPVTMLHRFFGYKVDVADPRHPQHFEWLRIESSYQSLANACKEGVLRGRRSLFEKRLRAAKQHTFWRNLTGREFEEHLTELLGRAGFTVIHVGGKGDEGADLIIKGQRTKIVVQCKAFSKPVGPGPVRDLFGALMHHGADEAWLVSLEGFSDAAISFSGGKPIRLLPVSALLGSAGRKFLTATLKQC